MWIYKNIYEFVSSKKHTCIIFASNYTQEPSTPGSVDSNKPEIASKPVIATSGQQHTQQQQPPLAHDPQVQAPPITTLGQPIGGVNQFGQPVGGAIGQPLGVSPMAQVIGQQPMAANPNVMQGKETKTI